MDPAAPRRQVICLLGGTFANLDNEMRFVRDSLCGFAPGTLLLIDFPMCFAPADQPEEIRRRDPWLSGAGRTSAWRERVMAFWSGPLRRYVPGVEGVEIAVELNLSASPVPGSYAIEARARVRVAGDHDRVFSVFMIKRHDPACLGRALRELGWEVVDGWPYGGEVGYPRALSLFRRVGQNQPAARAGS